VLNAEEQPATRRRVGELRLGLAHHPSEWPTPVDRRRREPSAEEARTGQPASDPRCCAAAAAAGRNRITITIQTAGGPIHHGAVPGASLRQHSLWSGSWVGPTSMNDEPCWLRPLCASSSLTTTTATAATYQTGSPLRQNRRRHGRARMDARTRPTAEPAPHFFQPGRKNPPLVL
jgi:hypothetical protein